MCTGKRQTHIRNAPSSRTAALGIGPYRVLRKSDSLPLYSDGIVSAWMGRMTSAVNFPFSV